MKFNINFPYKNLSFLGVTLNIYEREFIIILGTSGGGKTTLLNIMGTIDKPTKVKIYYLKFIFSNYKNKL